MTDRFGGIPVDEPQRDRFGGVPVVDEPKATQGTQVDAALSPGVGALQAAGAAPGLPVDAFGLLGEGANWLTGREWQPGMSPWQSGFTGSDWLKAAQKPVGPESEFLTPRTSVLRPAEIGFRWGTGQGGLGLPGATTEAPGSEVERIGRKLGGLVAFGPRTAMAGLTSTGTSEAGRALDKGGVTGGYGEMAGLLAGPLAHQGLLATGRGMLPRVEKDVAEYARALGQKGIDVAPAQMSANRTLGYTRSGADQISLFSSRKTAVQDDQFVRAVAKTIGEDSTRITQKVWDKAQARIGGNLERIYKSGVVDANNSPKFLGDLAQIETTATNALQPAQMGYVRKALDEVFNAVAKGPLKGEDAWTLIKYNAESALNNALKSSDDVVAGYALKIKRSIMDALEASAPINFKPDLTKYNKEYQNLITVGPLSIPNGGKVSPVALANRVYHAQGALRGELGEIAEAARVALKPLPDSGTAGRASAIATIMAPSAIVATGAAPAIPALGAWLAGTGAIAPGIRGLLDSKALAQAMINKALPQPQVGLLGALGSGGQALARSAPATAGLLGRQYLSPQHFSGAGLLSP